MTDWIPPCAPWGRRSPRFCKKAGHPLRRARRNRKTHVIQKQTRGEGETGAASSLLFKLLAGAALVAALTFGATVFFQVEHILIAGNSRYTAQEVEEASGIQLGDNLFPAEQRGESQRISGQKAALMWGG